MSFPGRSLPRAHLLPSVLAAVLLLAVCGLGACSSSGGASPADAASATDAVTATFNLPAEATTCLQEGFSGSAKAAEAMTATGELSTSQQDAVLKVLDGCVTPEEWAQVVAGRITKSIPPADVTQLDTQVNCLTTAVNALDGVQRRSLLVGLVVVRTAPQTGPLAIQRGDVLNTLYGACSVKAARSTSSTSVPAAG